MRMSWASGASGSQKPKLFVIILRLSEDIQSISMSRTMFCLNRTRDCKIPIRLYLATSFITPGVNKKRIMEAAVLC